MSFRDDRGVIDDSSRGTWDLGDDAEEVTFRKTSGEVRRDDLDAERLGASLDDGEGLRVEIGVDDKSWGLAAVRAAQERHGFGSGGGLVEHRRVCQFHAGEIGDHGLEVEEGFETALADLRLIRGVRGVPGRVLDDVAQQHRRRQRVEVAEADHRRRDGVLGCECSQFGKCLVLSDRKRQSVESGSDAVRGSVEDDGGNGLGCQFVE